MQATLSYRLWASRPSVTLTVTRLYYKEADQIVCEDEVAIIPIAGIERGILVKEGVTFEFPPFGQTRFRHWDLP